MPTVSALDPRIPHSSEHWLRVPERIRFRLCVLTFRCLNGTAPSYLADSICRVADVEGRRHLRSSATATLIVPPVRRSTLSMEHRHVRVLTSRNWREMNTLLQQTINSKSSNLHRLTPLPTNSSDLWGSFLLFTAGRNFSFCLSELPYIKATKRIAIILF